METIFALASAQGRAGVAVIRVSGPQAFAAASALCGDLPAPRQSGLRWIRQTDGIRLDQALVLRFAAGASFTGEPSVEFQTHGSPAVVRAVLAALSDQPGCRLAEPGEFTRRALENDQLDLAQVEGLSDLLEAETEAQRRQALAVFDGGLRRLAEAWRASLIRAMALVEAVIDFADEEVPEDVTPEVRALIAPLITAMQAEADGVPLAERVRDGFEIAILGPPNAGKSTLLNMLAGREAAITSDIAGTTRDVIEVRMDLRGLPVTFLDTAGLRDTQDQIERIGIDRALERARAADLRVVLAPDPAEMPDLTLEPDDIILRPKSDLDPGADISAKTGQGVDMLIDRIAAILENRTARIGTASHARHRAALLRAVDSLGQVGDHLDHGQDYLDLAAEELRHAAHHLDSLIGRVDVEQVLDDIFAQFCLGK